VKEDEVDGGGATVSWGCGVGKLVAELDAIVLICICAKCLIYARRHTFLQVATVATKQRYVIDHRSSIIRSYGVFTIRLLVVGKWLVNLPVVVGKCNSLDYRPVNLPTTFRQIFGFPVSVRRYCPLSDRFLPVFFFLVGKLAGRHRCRKPFLSSISSATVSSSVRVSWGLEYNQYSDNPLLPWQLSAPSSL
jgi:hypothetical protein